MNKYKKNRYNVKEELEVISKYQEFIFYVYDLLEKFPEKENFSLIVDIKRNVNYCLEFLILAKNTHKNDYALKIKFLNRAESYLTILMVLIRVAIKRKYIKSRNYTAWSFKVSEIENQISKWIVSLSRCQKS